MQVDTVEVLLKILNSGIETPMPDMPPQTPKHLGRPTHHGGVPAEIFDARFAIMQQMKESDMHETVATQSERTTNAVDRM